jgi:hypothetical protein
MNILKIERISRHKTTRNDSFATSLLINLIYKVNYSYEKCSEALYLRATFISRDPIVL